MIIPVVENVNVQYIKDDSIFLELSNVDDKNLYFDLYFEFNPSLILKDNILNFDFEIVDNSLISSQESINSELIKNNLPLQDIKDSNYFQLQNEVINFKKQLLQKSTIFTKTFNLTKSINNLNKNGKIIKNKNVKRNISDINNIEKYREIYLNHNGLLELNDVKKSIENDFLYDKKQIIDDYVSFKDSFILEKNKFNSNYLTFYLKLNNKNYTSKVYKKSLDISDILNIFEKNDVTFKVFKERNKNIISVKNNKSLKIKLYKNNIVSNELVLLSDSIINDKLIFQDTSYPLENIVYKLEYIENNSIKLKEFIINNSKNDFNCVISCHNTFEGISVNVLILNNTKNDFFVVKRKNLSKKESSYSFINNAYNSSFSFIDNKVKSNEIYEYSVFNNFDHKKEIASFIIERNNIKFSNKDFKVEKSVEKDIQFKITYLNDNNNIVSILKNFDLYDQYSDVLSKNNQSLKDLFYYKIDRLNKNTGEFVHLGWSQGEFSDKSSSNFLNVLEANIIDQYQYYITAYNVISVMFLTEEKELLTTSNGKKYIFDKNKWLQPLLLEKSISSDQKSRKKLYGKNDYEFGFSSETIIIDASYDEINQNSLINEISDLKINRKYKNFIVLEWNIESIFQIDHMLLTKTNENSYEELVDKFSIKEGKNTYFYRIEDNDTKLQFNIIPVSKELSFKKKQSFKVIEV